MVDGRSPSPYPLLFIGGCRQVERLGRLETHDQPGAEEAALVEKAFSGANTESAGDSQ